MPLIFNHFTNQSAQVLIWNMLETENELIKFLPEPEKFLTGISSIKLQKRRLQKITAELLLNQLGINQQEHIIHSSAGKPLLINGSHISWTNSEHYVAMIQHATQLVGIDIEEPSMRILKTAHRFVNSKELEWVNSNSPLFDYYLIWGVKECVFKAIGGGGILFKDHIDVQAPDENLNGKVIFSKEDFSVVMNYQVVNLDGLMMVYTIA
jgi:phosphopantetheinyl transferase